eukprot:7888665-Pyramimonas_sp.AAC.1
MSHTKHRASSDMAGLDCETSRWDMVPPIDRTRVAVARLAVLVMPCKPSCTICIACCRYVSSR